MLIVVVMVAVLLSIGVPSFKRFVVVNRLKAVTSQAVTDLQFARSEAAARNVPVYWVMRINATNSCYSIYTSTNPSLECDCLLGAGSACTDPSLVELKTVSMPRAVQKVRVLASGFRKFAFDNVSGGLVFGTTDFAAPTPEPFLFRSEIEDDATRKLQVTVSAAGRPSVCSYGTTRIPEYPAC